MLELEPLPIDGVLVNEETGDWAFGHVIRSTVSCGNCRFRRKNITVVAQGATGTFTVVRKACRWFRDGVPTNIERNAATCLFWQGTRSQA